MPDAARREPVGFDPTTPNVARMYDYYLGGKDNFAADREAAEQALAMVPELRAGAQEVRKFLRRTVQFLVDAGIRQFIDIGCGLPTRGNVHEIAQAIAPDARVAYVDNDPLVVAHGRALLEQNPLTTVIQADMRDPAKILTDPALTQLIDLEQPVGVLLVAVLHVLPDDEEAVRTVAGLRDAVAPGSYLAIAHAVSDLDPEKMAKLAALYQDKIVMSGPPRANVRTRADVEEYFSGLDVVEPGIVYINDWRSDSDEPWVGDTPIFTVGGIGRKK